MNKAQPWTAGIVPYKHACGCEMVVGPNWIEQTWCAEHSRYRIEHGPDGLRMVPKTRTGPEGPAVLQSSV